MVINMAVVLIKILVISCNNYEYDERDTNSGGNNYNFGDKPSRSYVSAREAHMSKN
jgi:hypothetical protein